MSSRVTFSNWSFILFALKKHCLISVKSFDDLIKIEDKNWMFYCQKLCKETKNYLCTKLASELLKLAENLLCRWNCSTRPYSIGAIENGTFELPLIAVANMYL